MIASGGRGGAGGRSDQASLCNELRSLVEIGPIALLIVGVLDSMYVGIGTPTEAAPLGASVSLAIAAVMRPLPWAAMLRALFDTV